WAVGREMRVAGRGRVLPGRVDSPSPQQNPRGGRARGAPLAIGGPRPPPVPPPPIDEAARQALTNRPDLDAARADVAMGAAKIRKEQADGRWDASVNVGYQRQDMGFDLNGITTTGATPPIPHLFPYFAPPV